MALRSYLARFPLPLNISEFKASIYGPRILANSCPKSGTHLLIRVLSLLPLLVPRWRYDIVSGKLQLPEKLPKIRKGQYIAAHLFWSQDLVDLLKDADILTLFIIRDLRDVAVSRAYYHTYSLTSHPAFTYLNSLKSDAERLMAAIVGIDKPGMGFPSLGDWARGYAPWLNEPICLTIRFEDLIGKSGGGSDEKQVEAVRAIVHHLGIELSENQIYEIASKAFFNKANTFRQGQIGEWKNHFTNDHIRAFNEVVGEALINLGQVNRYDW
jgi:hypothetical protein